MSYEPTKWQTGDIITLNKLNKLEQGVAAMMEEYQPTVWQIGDTVTSIKLNKLEQAVATLSKNSGGGGTRVELFNGTVTTEGSDGMYRGLVLGNGTTADEVYVTFDGTEYELPRVQFPGGGDYGYGAFGETGPDFSTYPLMLSYSPEGEGWFVFTETAGTHTIVAYTDSSGSGGITLGPLASMITGGAKENEEITVYVSTTPYDITSGETYSGVLNPIYNNTNVLSTRGNTVSISVPSGCYVVIEATVTNGWTTDSLVIHDASYSQQITSGFECRVFSDEYYTNVLFTTQIPANGLIVNFGNGINVGE